MEKDKNIINSLENLIEKYGSSPDEFSAAFCWFLSAMSEKTKARAVMCIGILMEKYGVHLQIRVEKSRLNESV